MPAAAGHRPEHRWPPSADSESGAATSEHGHRASGRGCDGHVRGRGRRRAVLRHLRAGAGRLAAAAMVELAAHRRRDGRRGRGAGSRRRRVRTVRASSRSLAGRRRSSRSVVPALGVRAAVALAVRAASRAVRSRCAVPARSSARLGPRHGWARGWSACRRCRGPTRARRCWTNPEVPERKRFCSRGDCGAPVGRARGDRPGRTEGFCTKCGHPYSFVPKLRRRRHRARPVRGGGLPGARRPRLDLPGRGPRGLRPLGGAQGPAGHRRRGRDGGGDLRAPLPRRDRALQHRPDLQLRRAPRPAHRHPRRLHRHGVRRRQVAQGDRQRAPHARTAGAIRCRSSRPCAYGIEALEALGHLHSRNLLYCDFKVDNAIQTEDQLKLIDMGAVRRMDDDESAPSTARSATRRPEVAEVGPSVASDLYTVARTLAVLTFDFQGYTNVFVDSPARPGQHRGLPAVRVLLPAAGAGHRPGPGAPVRLRARRWPSS